MIDYSHEFLAAENNYFTQSDKWVQKNRLLKTGFNLIPLQIYFSYKCFGPSKQRAYRHLPPPISVHRS